MLPVWVGQDEVGDEELIDDHLLLLLRFCEFQGQLEDGLDENLLI